jgi:hypothetical protein
MMTRDLAVQRLAHAGEVTTTTLTVTAKLLRRWAEPAAGSGGDVVCRYFSEAPKRTDAVGVAGAEKRAAAAPGGN